MSRKRKMCFAVLLAAFALDVALHFPGEWHKLRDVGNGPVGVQFLIYLSWNVFAASVEFLISPLGLLSVVVGLLIWGLATSPLPPPPPPPDD